MYTLQGTRGRTHNAFAALSAENDRLLNRPACCKRWARIADTGAGLELLQGQRAGDLCSEGPAGSNPWFPRNRPGEAFPFQARVEFRNSNASLLPYRPV